jgi:hypothetical protein
MDAFGVPEVIRFLVESPERFRCLPGGDRAAALASRQAKGQQRSQPLIT